MFWNMSRNNLVNFCSNWSTVPYKGYCTTVSTGTTITALGVEVRWKSTDLYLYDPNSPGMARQVSKTAASTETSSSSGSNVQTTSTPSSTSPAVIGGAVGGALGAIIIALVVILVFIMKKRRTKRNDARDDRGQSTKAELDGQGSPMQTQYDRHYNILTPKDYKSGLPLELAASTIEKSGLPPELAASPMVKSTIYEIDAEEQAIHELGLTQLPRK